jgi:hypothetical protein
MDFKQWLVLNEEINLPYKIIGDIHDFVMDQKKLRLQKPKTALPTKDFIIDFSDTPYNFLNSLSDQDRTINVDNNLSSSKKAGGFTNSPKPKFLMNLNNNTYNFLDTIQHEIMHFMQHLIQKFAAKKNLNKFIQQMSNREDGEDMPPHHKVMREKPRKLGVKQPKYLSHIEPTQQKKDPFLGFMPPPQLIKKIMADRGFDVKGNQKERRTTHALRPIEYYTNLATLMNYLKQNFYWHHVKDSSKPLQTLNNTEIKKNYFKEFIKQKYFQELLKDVKNLDQDLYKIYINKITKEFITKEFTQQDLDVLQKNKEKDADVWLHDKELKAKKEQDKLDKAQKFQNRLNKVGTDSSMPEGLSPALFIKKPPVVINWDDRTDYSTVGDGNDYEYAEELFDAIDANQKSNKWGEIESIKIPTSLKNIKDVFKKLKDYKKTKTDEDMAKNVDKFAKKIARDIAVNIGYATGWVDPKLDERTKNLLDFFYKS